jgi:hypothetical protein
MALVCTCGTQLPDNARFCHHCGKPQREQDIAREADPPPLPETPVPFPRESQPLLNAVGFGNPMAVRVALLCGSLSALLNALPFVSFGCCLWMIGAGFLAVHLYGRRTGLMLEIRQGTRLGGMTGLFGFVITVVLTFVSLALAGATGGLRETLRQSMERISAQDEVTRQVIDFLTSPAGLAISLVLYLMLGFLAMVSLAMAGGALGAKVLERD